MRNLFAPLLSDDVAFVRLTPDVTVETAVGFALFLGVALIVLVVSEWMYAKPPDAPKEEP